MSLTWGLKLVGLGQLDLSWLGLRLILERRSCKGSRGFFLRMSFCLASYVTNNDFGHGSTWGRGLDPIIY